MIRAAAVLAVMVLLGNNGLPRRMWPGTASAAATKVPGSVVRWVDRYNAALARAKLTYRVVMVGRCPAPTARRSPSAPRSLKARRTRSAATASPSASPRPCGRRRPSRAHPSSSRRRRLPNRRPREARCTSISSPCAPLAAS